MPPALDPGESRADLAPPRAAVVRSLKLAVLATCQAMDSSSPFPPEVEYLELTICDVGALRNVPSDPTQTPLVLPHLRPNHKVRASRTFSDHRDNRALADELAARYTGKVIEGVDPVYWVVGFPLSKADRIFPEYFLKPVDHSLRNAAT